MALVRECEYRGDRAKEAFLTDVSDDMLVHVVVLSLFLLTLNFSSVPFNTLPFHCFMLLTSFPSPSSSSMHSASHISHITNSHFISFHFIFIYFNPSSIISYFKSFPFLHLKSTFTFVSHSISFASLHSMLYVPNSPSTHSHLAYQKFKYLIYHNTSPQLEP